MWQDDISHPNQKLLGMTTYHRQDTVCPSKEQPSHSPTRSPTPAQSLTHTQSILFEWFFIHLHIWRSCPRILNKCGTTMCVELSTTSWPVSLISPLNKWLAVPKTYFYIQCRGDWTIITRVFRKADETSAEEKVQQVVFCGAEVGLRCHLRRAP